MEKENFNRNYIMHTLRVYGSITISKLAEIVELSRPTIYLHLDNLEKKGFIKRTKDIKKKGAPVIISIVENSVKRKDKEELLKFLENIKKSKDLTLSQLKLSDLGFSSGYMTATFLGLIDKKIFLTDKGGKYLEDNKGVEIVQSGK